MSEETPDEAEAKPVATGPKSEAPRLRKSNIRDSDMTARPGFRNPANKRSKATKKKRKKR